MEDAHLMEDFVVNSIVTHLKSKGYRIVSFATGRNHGIDVHAAQENHVILVEAKGAKGNSQNGPVKRQKFDSGQIKDHLGKAILKVLELKNHDPNAELWIAHPDTPAIRTVVEPVKKHLSVLGIKCVYVSQSGTPLGHE
jgi:hypothetical protein